METFLFWKLSSTIQMLTMVKSIGRLRQTAYADWMSLLIPCTQLVFFYKKQNWSGLNSLWVHTYSTYLFKQHQRLLIINILPTNFHFQNVNKSSVLLTVTQNKPRLTLYTVEIKIIEQSKISLILRSCI